MKQEWFIVACVVLGMVSFSCATNPCGSVPCSFHGMCWEDTQTTAYECSCDFLISGVNCEIRDIVNLEPFLGDKVCNKIVDIPMEGDINVHLICDPTAVEQTVRFRTGPNVTLSLCELEM